jgi:hypothetical protein
MDLTPERKALIFIAHFPWEIGKRYELPLWLDGNVEVIQPFIPIRQCTREEFDDVYPDYPSLPNEHYFYEIVTD